MSDGTHSKVISLPLKTVILSSLIKVRVGSTCHKLKNDYSINSLYICTYACTSFICTETIQIDAYIVHLFQMNLFHWDQLEDLFSKQKYNIYTDVYKLQHKIYKLQRPDIQLQ